VNDTASLPGPAGAPPPNRVRALHSVKAHKSLAYTIFLIVAAPGLVFAWFHGRPQYVAEAKIQVAPNFATTLQEPDELKDQANRYDTFLQQQVLNIVRYEVLERALDQLGKDRDYWQGPDETITASITRLQESLEVTAVHGSYTISVALPGSRKEGLAEIVNAVVDSYLATQRSETLFAGDDRVKALEVYRAEQQADMDKELAEKSTIAQQLGVTSFDRTLASPMQAQVDETSKALGEARRAQIVAEAKVTALDASEKQVQGIELQSEARLTLEKDPVFNDQASPLLSRRGTLQAQINSQMLIQAHIKASSVIVDFTDKQEADLDKLNEKMDQFIISGLTINALLNLVPKVVDTAISIGNTISGHIGQA